MAPRVGQIVPEADAIRVSGAALGADRYLRQERG
jgi:hypothetical protein